MPNTLSLLPGDYRRGPDRKRREATPKTLSSRTGVHMGISKPALIPLRSVDLDAFLSVNA
jgi:hypothetical protein